MKTRDARTKLFGVLDALVEDVQLQSHEELLAETVASGEEATDLIAQADRAIEAARQAAGRAKLARARTRLNQQGVVAGAKLTLTPAQARAVFHRVRDRNQALAQTLAARGGQEPNDQQVLDILQDWLALGSVSEDDLKQ
ncbi:MAG: hypothetical protein JSS77_12990 [Acidobacteria bacterium]|nr:hypothetical protein [Acidobacteriota bacterium]